MNANLHWARSLFFWGLSIGLVIAMVALLISQRRTMVQLEGKLELARLDVAELKRLRAENARLQQQQISPQEIALLRADHAALPRLRAELETLEKNATSARR